MLAVRLPAPESTRRKLQSRRSKIAGFGLLPRLFCKSAFLQSPLYGTEMIIKGSLVALVTPMFEDGALDLDAYRGLIDWHIAEGTNAIVAVGTTGESPTVDPREHGELIRVAVEAARGRVPVIAGTGGNSTAEAIELTAHARAVGANATLQVVPYYNKPTQEGLYRHFRKVAESVDLPMIVYNVPSRTVADLANDTAVRLAGVPGIVGIKDATGDLARAADLLRRLPQDFAVYSGNDDSALPLIQLGGHGVISVTANVAPRTMSELCAAALAGELARARALNNQLLPLHAKLFIEPNPTAVKWALARLGRIRPGTRLPLLPLSADKESVVSGAMHEAGLL
jgi:4-hydroxy-tetrahydrodipicolinate synthase